MFRFQSLLFFFFLIGGPKSHRERGDEVKTLTFRLYEKSLRSILVLGEVMSSLQIKMTGLFVSGN